MTTPPPHDENGLPRGQVLRREVEITAREARDMLRAGMILLIDCRTREEREVAHVVGSLNIPLDDLEKRRDEIEPRDGQGVAVICHHGVRSMRGALALRAWGFEHAMSVAGGIDAWSLSADNAVPRYDRAGGVCRIVPPKSLL
jgi:rhodanese-related sulfurtransferase